MSISWYTKIMEEDQPKQPNKYIEYIKNNKYNVYFIVAIAILLVLIISMIAITVNSTKKGSSITQAPTPTQASISSSPSSNSISPSISNITITTPNPTEAAVIDNQTQPQITPNVGAPYTVSAIKQYGENWALMKITNPDVGAGYVIVKKVNGVWKVMLGPGTSFSQQELQNIGAPSEILNDANTGI
jgi:hypothetical protein